MATAKAITRVDEMTDWVDAHNRIVDRDKGNFGDPVVWRYNGASYQLDADNPAGNHANFGTGMLLVQDAAITAGTVVKVTDGSNGAPAIAFTSDTDTGIYRASADTAAVVAGGSVVAEWTNTAGAVQFLAADGSVTLPVWGFLNDANCGLYRVGADDIAVSAGGVLAMEWKTTSSIAHVSIGGGFSSFSPAGLTINHGADDGEAIAFKNSDVAHGITSRADTDVYGMLCKGQPTTGGIQMAGFSEATISVYVWAISTTNDTTRSTAAVGAINLDAAKKSGTSNGTNDANGNLVVVMDNASARFLVDKEGDIHMDATSNINAWDDADDTALLEAFRVLTAPGVEQNYRQRFSDDIAAHAQILHDTGVITLNEDGHHFVSLKGILGLLIDHGRQLRGRIDTLERRCLALEAEHG